MTAAALALAGDFWSGTIDFVSECRECIVTAAALALAGLIELWDHRLLEH